MNFRKLINFIVNKDNYLVSGFRVLSNLLANFRDKET